MAETSGDAPKITATVTVAWSDKGLHIETGGAGLTPDQLMLAAAYLVRTANQLLDAETMRRQATPQGIIRAAAIPDELRSVNDGR